MMRLAYGIVFCVHALCLFGMQAGSVHGTVVDPDDALIADAHITIQKQPNPAGTSSTFPQPETLSTNPKGDFSAELAPGSYKICASRAGFIENCREIELHAKQDLTLNFSLQFIPIEHAGSEILDRRLEVLSGADAVNCGQVKVNENPRAPNHCALEAAKHHRAFHVRYDSVGIDSEIADGIAMDSSGNAFGVLFDSMELESTGLPKGATMPDGSHTVVLACPKPLKFRVNKQGRITCFSKSQPFFWAD